MTLSYEEEEFIADVRSELNRYEMTSSQTEEVVEQIREHLEASREHGENGLHDLGSPRMYVRDYAEVQGFEIVQNAGSFRSGQEDSGQRSGRPSVWGLLRYPLVFAAVYAISQLVFSFSLTTAWVEGREMTGFNLLYRISDQMWWNMLLIVFSLSISTVVTTLIYKLSKRKQRRPFPHSVGGRMR